MKICLRCGDDYSDPSLYCRWCIRRRDKVLRRTERKPDIELWQLAAWVMGGKGESKQQWEVR